MKTSPYQILILRLIIGALFFSIGLSKIHAGWLGTDAHLVPQLETYRQTSTPAQLWYLDHVAVPYASLWARLISGGEIALGISLMLGLLSRLSSGIGIILLLNIYAANGSLFSLSLFATPWGAPLLGSLIIIFLSRAGRWVGIDNLLMKTNSRSILW